MGGLQRAGEGGLPGESTWGAQAQEGQQSPAQGQQRGLMWSGWEPAVETPTPAVGAPAQRSWGLGWRQPQQPAGVPPAPQPLVWPSAPWSRCAGGPGGPGRSAAWCGSSHTFAHRKHCHFQHTQPHTSAVRLNSLEVDVRLVVMPGVFHQFLHAGEGGTTAAGGAQQLLTWREETAFSHSENTSWVNSEDTSWVNSENTSWVNSEPQERGTAKWLSK